MPRRFGVGLAVFALLVGLFAAPFTHAHHAIESVTDERHPHGATLVHSHASTHAHRHSDGIDPLAPHEDDDVRAVSAFVFQQCASIHAPAPDVFCCEEAALDVSTAWFRAHLTQPNAHSPPIGFVSSLRAPPAVLPSFS